MKTALVLAAGALIVAVFWAKKANRDMLKPLEGMSFRPILSRSFVDSEVSAAITAAFLEAGARQSVDELAMRFEYETRWFHDPDGSPIALEITLYCTSCPSPTYWRVWKPNFLESLLARGRDKKTLLDSAAKELAEKVALEIKRLRGNTFRKRFSSKTIIARLAAPSGAFFK